MPLLAQLRFPQEGQVQSSGVNSPAQQGISDTNVKQTHSTQQRLSIRAAVNGQKHVPLPSTVGHCIHWTHFLYVCQHLSICFDAARVQGAQGKVSRLHCNEQVYNSIKIVLAQRLMEAWVATAAICSTHSLVEITVRVARSSLEGMKGSEGYIRAVVQQS